MKTTSIPKAAEMLHAADDAPALRSSFEDTLGTLWDTSRKLLGVCAQRIATECCQYLGHIRGIVATFRMTARAPTSAAQYSSLILNPLRQILEQSNLMERLGAQHRESLQKQVIEDTALKFASVSSETLGTARKTEISLKKLKSRKNLSDPTEGDHPIISTDTMVEMQLRYDIEQFVKEATIIVADLESSDAIKELKKVAASESKK